MKSALVSLCRIQLSWNLVSSLTLVVIASLLRYEAENPSILITQIWVITSEARLNEFV